MSGEQEYSFRGLNETRIHSNLSCCGSNCIDFNFAEDSCDCQLLSCAFSCNFNRPTELRSKHHILKTFLFAMINCGILAVFAFGIYYVAHVNADIEKYKVCVVDGRGGFQRSGKYCPILDEPDSKVECVIGLDRLDCLRRISKGKVDFGVFTAEDLVAAQNSLVEILLTNELRFSKDKYEYDVVAIVNDDAGINSKHDLQDKRFCHPGYGQETEWSRILANYFEATVVPKLCEESLSLTENRIKAAAQYFRAACKAGPWVSDDLLDQKLKKKYSNLCALCGVPGRCSKRDKYWGRRGPLYCLTDGVGDVTWARLDDAKAHFGITPGAQSADPEGFSYLCPDGSKRPVNTTNPCVWVSKPWPVILAKRSSAQEIQGFINRLNHSDTDSWQNALLNLIESYHVDITSVTPIKAIQSYLDQAPGFLSAYSFTGCHPPRSIRMCTTSNIENSKCGWMREAAAVYGIEPDFDCVKADNKTHCLLAIQTNLADAVLLSPDYILTAERDFKLVPLLYEDVRKENRYETVAVIRKDSTINKFSDLRYKKACFPQFEGIAWNTMLYEFHKRGLLSHECPYSVKAANFWGETCAPDAPKSVPKSLTKLCNGEYLGDEGALKCLVMEQADVAFVSLSSVRKLAASVSNEDWISLIKAQTKILCENKLKQCKLSWATIGQVMVSGSSSEMFQQETYDAFMQADSLFGNNYDSLTRSFSLYGPFDGQHNILFDDDTTSLQGKAYMNTIEETVPSYDVILSEVSECLIASSNSLKPSFLLFLTIFYVVMKFSL